MMFEVFRAIKLQTVIGSRHCVVLEIITNTSTFMLPNSLVSPFLGHK